MVKQTIRIFCRLKPTKQPAGNYETIEDEGEEPSIAFSVPRDLADGYINNKKEIYRFKFDKLFETKAKQDEVFNAVAKPVVQNALLGYNGTIFAYGQTGSGKTFTITGGAERYVDRGIIPRSLSLIFQQYQNNPSIMYTTHISYLEIYNDSGYDLLDPRHEAAKLEDLPKVSLLEDNEGNIHLKNLSLHTANSEEDALNLLFLGDTNRMIAETPMNQASTRSHCIFTIHISAKEQESATVRRSKFHLVDLAGSERVSKTGVGGVLLKEAKYINLSLHYLEQVIIALSEKSRSHIPYRNSMMTSVLRDSLGGNCMTSMIATCSVSRQNIDESISTCRFAQRVALIKNDAILNEEIDPQLMIARLKNEIQQLKDELALTTGQQYDEELSAEDKARLQEQVANYLNDVDGEALLSVGADMRKINFCFHFLKRQHHLRETRSSPAREQAFNADSSYLADKSEVGKLKELIRQRDNEINILVGMLKKEREKAGQKPSYPSEDKRRIPVADILAASKDLVATKPSHNDEQSKRPSEITHRRTPSLNSAEEQSLVASNRRGTRAAGFMEANQVKMSLGRQEAFESFKRDHHSNETIENHKRNLKQRYGDAKLLGEKVNRSRMEINRLKGHLEQARMQSSLEEDGRSSTTEASIREALDKEKQCYKESFHGLKTMKQEIEHVQFLLEKCRVQIQKDFDIWWMENCKTSFLNASQQSGEIPLATSTTGDVFHNQSSQPFADSSHPHSMHAGTPTSRPMATASFNEREITPSHAPGSSTSTTGRSSSVNSAGIQLTGNAQVDANIMAFVRARQQVIQNGGSR